MKPYFLPFLFLPAVLLGCANLEPKVLTVNTSIERPTVFEKQKLPETSSTDQLTEQCVSLANVAKSIAILRDGGAPQSEIPFLVLAPQYVPLTAVSYEVYNSGISPDQVHRMSFQSCQTNSWSVIQLKLRKLALALQEQDQVNSLFHRGYPLLLKMDTQDPK